MLKVLIAEDEQLERDYLKVLIEQNFSDRLQIDAVLRDGEEAYCQALKSKPDIVLMDIHMPKMNGLETVKRIKEHYPDTKIIIITAHSQFEYAQEALRLGVDDYLVKPYSDEKFIETLDKSILKTMAIIEQRNKNKDLEKQVALFSELMEKEIIMDLICGGSLDEQALIRFTSFLGIIGSPYACMTISLGEQDERTLNDALVKEIKVAFRNKVGKIIGYSFLNLIVLFLVDDNVRNTYDVNRMSGALVRYLEENYLIAVMTGVSDVHYNVLTMKESYQQAIESLEVVKANSGEVTMSQTDFTQNMLHTKEQVLFKNINDMNHQEAIKSFEEITTLLFSDALYSKNIEVIKDYMKHLCFAIGRNTNEALNIRLGTEYILNSLDSFERLNNMKQVVDLMERYVNDVIQVLIQHSNSDKNRIVKEAKRYLESHFRENVNLHEVADYLEVSYGHLSKSFKKSEGLSFTEYLTQVRMEKAKTLLREKHMTVYEVAFEVGYSDPNYFSRTFKKQIGISPKDYSNG